MDFDLKRPYLVIPKLIEQPTWGGDYIANFKTWSTLTPLSGKKIGQSYELFDGSNLSTLLTSSDPKFLGELCISGIVSEMTQLPHSIPLKQLISENPELILGKTVFETYGKWMPLLIKFTQGLGNSFQIHLKSDMKHPKWKPKPESWYYFEPGLITLGVKNGINWSDYQKVVTELNEKIVAIGQKVKDDAQYIEEAKRKIQLFITQTNPWQFVNIVETKKDELFDLSPCGIHHSWEEDETRFHWGNVLYELQLNVMDNESTIRAFDKGKIKPDGSTRPLQIEDYFALIDRSPEANNPAGHTCVPATIQVSKRYDHQRLLKTKYYTLERIVLTTPSIYTEKIDSFRHIFVKSGSVEVFAGHTTITVTTGHSCFIPAGAVEFGLKNITPVSTTLISY